MVVPAFAVSVHIHSLSGRFWSPVSASENSVPGRHVFRRGTTVRLLGLANRNADESRLVGIQSERFELKGPFGRRIAKSFDANTPGQAALDGGSDESRREKGE